MPDGRSLPLRVAAGAIALLAWLTIVDSALASSVDFDTQIMPLLTKAGCNTGACHGAAIGRGGFHLSLFGSDPAADFQAITQEREGRRVNLTHPERSLVLRKPIADLDHGGDQRFAHDSPSAQLLRQWLHDGAPRLQQRRLVDVRVTPEGYAARQPGDELTVAVTATFDDGTRVDVTPWAVLTAEDAASLEVIASGSVRVLRRGPHLLLVRYLDRIVPVRVVLPYGDPPAEANHSGSPASIDEFIEEQLHALGLPASPAADDLTFLRRVTLDLTGRLPTPRGAEAFLQETSIDKRAAVVDALMSSDEFALYWTYEFAKLLRLRPLGADTQVAVAFHEWLRAQWDRQTPYDELARALLLASGDSHEPGPAGFHRFVAGPREQAEFVSELFLGVRLRCANCHDHPLDRWTQDDYHGLAAVFAGVQRGREVTTAEAGDVIHPRTQEPAVPRLPGDRFLPDAADRVDELSAWLTSAENSYFARSIVNRLWRHLMGRGLVEPVDDLRATNPGTHPDLLAWLAEDFTRHDYSVRHTLRRIVLSRAYQRSGQPTEGNLVDERYSARFVPKPLPAEVLADAVADVTGVPFVYGGLPEGTRAIALLDPRIAARSLDLLGRCDREGACEVSAGGGSGGGVAVKLHLLNGEFLNAAIVAAEGRLSRRLASGTGRDDLIEEFYLRALTRHPTPAERTYWQDALTAATADEQRALTEDFLWSLLSSSEFMTNH